ncbi:MAG: ATPase, T2SS/T4P/T4SS family, partial [Candidatus Thermoplasmatota archaeon]|nr:ATPase, T2SS/T4P/T4SS family [Candidatus Thermoplasmatota archaeon]
DAEAEETPTEPAQPEATAEAAPEPAQIEEIEESEIEEIEVEEVEPETPDEPPTEEQPKPMLTSLASEDGESEENGNGMGRIAPATGEEDDPWIEAEALEAVELTPMDEAELEEADLEEADPAPEEEAPETPAQQPAEPMAAEASAEPTGLVQPEDLNAYVEDEADEPTPTAGEEEAQPMAVDAAAGQGGADLTGGALESDQQTRQLLKSIKKQQKLRAKQELAEAKALEEQAKELLRQAKERKKIRSELEAHTERVEALAPELGFDPNRPITEIPDIDEDQYTQVEFTTVKDGFSYVRILYDNVENRYLYQVIEPELNTTELEVLDFLRDTLVRTLESRPGLSPEEQEAYLAEAIDQAILDHSILVDEVSRERLKYYITRDFLGYGPVDVLMRDPMIEDISCDGPGIPIYLFHRQYESLRTSVIFEDDYELDSFVIRLAQRCGKHISIAEPILDATLPDTSRLQATLSREVTTRGSSFTVRRFRSDPLTPPDLVRLGTMSSTMAAWYWMCMEEGMSLIYAGGTASGKTTSLNAICQFIPPERKVVSIEDTREINLIHENWIAGLTRSGFGNEGKDGKGSGSVDMYRLLEAALRQRPEYLLVGEVRGGEAKTLFQAMATGHATYSTMHADSVKSAVYRLENPPISIPRIMLQTLDTVCVQGQARLNQRMVRRVKEVTEIVGIDPDTGDLLTNTVFKWDPNGDQHRFYGKSVNLEHIAEKNNLTMGDVLQELENRQRVLEWLVEAGVRHISDVNDVFSSYYADPDRLLDKLNQGTLKMRSEREQDARDEAAAEAALEAAAAGEDILPEEMTGTQEEADVAS